jgi:hypothetical protein
MTMANGLITTSILIQGRELCVKSTSNSGSTAGRLCDEAALEGELHARPTNIYMRHDNASSQPVLLPFFPSSVTHKATFARVYKISKSTFLIVRSVEPKVSYDKGCMASTLVEKEKSNHEC